MKLLKHLRDDLKKFSEASELKSKTINAKVCDDGRIYIHKDHQVYSLMMTIEEAEILKAWLNALA